MLNWYKQVLKKYAVFQGRARRKELWSFTLINFLVCLLIMIFEYVTNTIGIIIFIYLLAVLIPSISVTIRRLHDTNRSGWWYLTLFIPFIGIILLIFMLQNSVEGANKYGLNPKENAECNL